MYKWLLGSDEVKNFPDGKQKKLRLFLYKLSNLSNVLCIDILSLA